MTRTAKSRNIRYGKTYIRNLNSGFSLKGEVSPCVFMYQGYPLQVTVTLTREVGTSLGDAYAVDRTLSAETATDADITRLLAGIRTISCPRCSTPAFDPTTIETNRAGLCEACFLGDLEAGLAEHEEEERRRLADSDHRMKANGMKIRVSAGIHSEAGGDDYQVDWYFATPPVPPQIRTLLHEAGSTILDDFQVVTL